jgi:c(7)-type cytochrome triheme protein
MMKKFIVFAVAVCFVFSLTGLAMASPAGKKVEYGDQKIGAVVFDGKSHAKTAKCKDCHPAPWKMKKGEKMTMAEMKAGKGCGACHDGKKTFGISECAKCHKK